MRPDSALSHLRDEEICMAEMKDGTRQRIQWNRRDWCFLTVDTPVPTVCSFDDIKEWRLITIVV